MFNLRPSPVDLFTAAKRAIADWNPHDASDLARAEVMLAGRAAAVALREVRFLQRANEQTALDIRSFYGETGGALNESTSAALWARLANDIGAGRFDTEPERLALYALLTAAARRWLQIANPRYARQRASRPDTTAAPNS